MKIIIDGRESFELSETEKKVIKNDIHEDLFDQDMERRIKWVLKHKYERCLERLKQEWLPKLKDRVASIPTNDEELAELIFSQPDYKDRKSYEAIKA